MREGWTYKKLGEVCNTITDGSHNPPKGIECSEYRMISSQNVFDDEIRITNENVRFLTKEDHYKEDKRTKLSKDVVLLTIVGTIGRACVLKGTEGFITLQRSVAALHPSADICPRFLMHVLIGNRNKLESEAHGIAQRGIYLRQLSELEVPVPKLSVQQSIIEELDKINELITLKKAQLSDLDSLALSIFYEMFGDPVENEKGWQVKKLSEVSTLLNGRAYKQNELLNEGKYKVLRVGNFFTNSNYYYSNLELEDNKYCDNGDLLFAWSASFGAFIWSGEKVIYHYHIWKVLYDESSLNKLYYCYLLNTMTNSFMNDLHGIGMMHLTKVGMEQYHLPLPPLSLQQDFARRIEVIEQQKVQISSTIKDLETLLASRMQYWFD